MTQQEVTETVSEITTPEELREALGGYPSGRAVTKERPALHPLQIEWLHASPFCVLATSDADGNCDASPKGDPAGHLIHVLDPNTVVIAERPGNKRADGYLNILSNPHVGLLALIPGRNDTLRINGRARLVRDAPWFDELAVRGKRPILAVVIEIETVFSHCPKAFMRSGLWEPESWPSIEDMPSVAALCKAVQNPAETLEELEAYYAKPNYSGMLY
ncbi:pyridoxamine 5'-phosphate oxidase family protein [Trebonia kvetii]|uniref:Pyridoxamine 5'-phosphate oxidase family protein n=1 Tax=Trebonia kvetii TaxID=2480626 RepID=A0A6P2BL80_9ACTN|nr:pyridoxamine 5'-phosphate oxidase family protein [Trebonia kvetii]TVY99649.1 pyridoxamine 5'-phosphate oxidase family protein [Trebonia kvetii]